ncbi:MAG: porin family protein [Bacteroidales bacterium]
MNKKVSPEQKHSFIKLYIAVFLIAFPCLTSAQGLRFSVFADPQISWLKSESRIAENAGIRGGFNAGFEMDNFFSENYALSTGLSLNSLGGKLKFTDSVAFQFDNHADADTLTPGNIAIYKLQYLNVPLGLKFTTREIGYTTIYVRLGVSGHFNIKSNADISTLNIRNESLDDEIEFFNLSYQFATGIHYSLGGQTAFIAGFEYRHRFLDIAANDNYKALLNSVSLRLGLLF